MRTALDRIIELYSTSPVFQDLVETAAVTGATATGQALLTDMTAEEIALASAVGAGAGMVGRPIVGRAGQAIGGIVDRRAPNIGRALGQGLDEAVVMANDMSPAMGKVLDAKLNPYRDLGGAAQYGQLVGRQYGDNLAQLTVALAAPAVFGGEDNA